MELGHSWRLLILQPVMTDDPLPTRASLLHAIKDAADPRGAEFHETYRGLILGVARRAGLSDHEADEALQDVLLAVSQKIPDFQYDPAKDSFKGWLLQITRWKIADQFGKRAGHAKRHTPSGDDIAQLTAGSSLSRNPTHPPISPPHSIISGMPAGSNCACAKRLIALNARSIPPTTPSTTFTSSNTAPPPKSGRSLGVNRAQIYLAKHRSAQL